MSEPTLEESRDEYICQSCAMPMDRTEQRGTKTDGTPSTEYCTYCLRAGRFTHPELTKQQMIAQATMYLMSERHMPQDMAGAVARRMIGGLKRWLNGAS